MAKNPQTETDSLVDDILGIGGGSDHLAVAFLVDDILGIGQGAETLESEHMPEGKVHRRPSARRRFERIRQKETLRDVIASPPAPGESIHVIGTGLYDFWTFVPQFIDWIGRAERLTCSTWTASRPNVIELFEIWDAGRIGTVDFLTGLYFKRRESAVYAMLLGGIRKRGGRYKASRNHAKVLLLENPDRDAWIVVEGSANLTANPRLEQYVITNDRALYDFHRSWTEEVLTR